MEQEIWKTFFEYDTLNGHTVFEISNKGRVRNATTGRIRKPNKLKSGYESISIQTFEGKKVEHRFYIHRLMAEAFIPNPDNKREVDHINGIKDDNRLENLRWVTSSENKLNPSTNIGYRLTLSMKSRAGKFQKKPRLYKKSPIVLLLEKQIPL